MNALITFFAVVGPAFYAPAFAQIGHEFGSVWFGVAYAAVISLALTALHEAVKLMEDPFVSYITIDGIDVFEELSIVYYLQLLRARETIFPDAPAFGSRPPDTRKVQKHPKLRRSSTFEQQELQVQRGSGLSEHRSSSRFSISESIRTFVNERSGLNVEDIEEEQHTSETSEDRAPEK